MSYYNKAMDSLIKRRNSVGMSQRRMASRSALSFRTIQLMESGAHDPKLSTLQQIATSLGYPKKIIEKTLAAIFEQPVDSIATVSEKILSEGKDSWKIWLFNFVDAFRKYKDPLYVDAPPVQGLPNRINALIASTVEALCEELKMQAPPWCDTVSALQDPWFVAGAQNLKAMSIMESPLYFRKRNIFVLDNFLSRR